jgi:energy-coupling factor transporter ATP-binding protein EcfA2
MFKLQRLKVHQCRSVLPGTELEFNGGFNIPLGKNGAGKTTLLKLVSAAIGSCFADEFPFDDLHVEYQYTLDDIEISCEVQQGDAGGGVSLVGDAVAPRMRDFSFKAQFSGLNAERIVGQIRGNRLEITSEGVRLYSREISAMVPVAPSLDLVFFIALFLPESTLSTAVRKALGHRFRPTYRLDEGMDWLRETLRDFAIIFAATDDDEHWCLPNVRHIGAADEFQAALAAYRGRFAELPEVITLHSRDLPFLARACQQIGLSDVSWTLSFLEHDRRTNETKRYGNSQVYVTTTGGTRLPLEKLSFGQLRLFGFFLHSLMHPQAVVVDELTNGLHHEMIDCCLETIGKRQAFLATQNPLLIDYVGFASAEEARRTFILCDLRARADGEQAMLWRNMNEEEAREFFGDYEVGVQHANDILRKRGLW